MIVPIAPDLVLPNVWAVLLGSAARGPAQDDKVDAGNVSVPHVDTTNGSMRRGQKGHDGPRERTAEEPAGNLMMPLDRRARFADRQGADRARGVDRRRLSGSAG